VRLSSPPIAGAKLPPTAFHSALLLRTLRLSDFSIAAFFNSLLGSFLGFEKSRFSRFKPNASAERPPRHAHPNQRSERKSAAVTSRSDDDPGISCLSELRHASDDGRLPRACRG